MVGAVRADSYCRLHPGASARADHLDAAGQPMPSATRTIVSQITDVAVGPPSGPRSFSPNAVGLTGVANAQTLVVNLSGVSDGILSGDVPVAMSVLVGDVSGDGVVNAGDAAQTRSRAGQTTDATNYRFDINADGFVNSGDAVVARSRSGTVLP